MKILYSVQATGNGHISRAMELIPYLQQYGTIDIFLSGSNSSLDLSVPVKFRSKGLSLFYTCKGKLDFLKIASSFAPFRLRKEINELPVEKYDLILNDFECITALACATKNIPSVNFGHQASFQSSKTPRPKEKSRMGEWILKNYAPASVYAGLHFARYDDFIFLPVIKKQIHEATPADKGFITVYLPSYCESVLEKYFHPLSSLPFHIFSWETKQIRKSRNITFYPVDKDLFNDALINCHGIITGGGFETPAEALKLGKKLMVIPIGGQYEQQCNAAALELMGIKKLNKLDDDFSDHFDNWLSSKPIKSDYNHTTENKVNSVMQYVLTQLKDKYEREPVHHYSKSPLQPIIQ